MTSEQEFSANVASYKQVINNLEDVTDPTSIELTVKRLTTLHFSPTLIFPTDNFLHFSKQDVLKEIDRVVELSAEEADLDPKKDLNELKLEHIGLLVYHFKQLLRLRRDDPEAWDEIGELYEED